MTTSSTAKEPMARVNLTNTVAVNKRGKGEYRAGPGQNLLVPAWFAKAIGVEYKLEDGEQATENGVGGASAPSPGSEGGNGAGGQENTGGTTSDPIDVRRAALFKEYDELGDREELIAMAQRENVEVKGTGKDMGAGILYVKKDDVIKALVERDLARDASGFVQSGAAANTGTQG
jgi:hypothetical protein